MRPELVIVQPSALRVSAICSLPIGTALKKMVKLDAAGTVTGGGSGA